MNFSVFLGELGDGISKYKDDFLQKLLLYLLGKYRSLNPSVYVSSYEVSGDGHLVELKVNDSFFFTLNFNEKDIHLIIGYFEQIYFFEDTSFRLNYQDIFDKIFKGNYKIVQYGSLFSTTSMLFFNDETEKLNTEISALVRKNKAYNVIEGKTLVNR